MVHTAMVFRNLKFYNERLPFNEMTEGPGIRLQRMARLSQFLNGVSFFL